MTAFRALTYASLLAAACGFFSLSTAAPAVAATPSSCGHSTQSDDLLALSAQAIDSGNYMLSLQEEFDAQTLDEQGASKVPGGLAQANCFATLLVSGVQLVQDEESYWQSSQAWNYARHLATLWRSFQGYRLTPAQKASYTNFFTSVTQALYACYPDCPVSDDVVAQTKTALLTEPESYFGK